MAAAAIAAASVVTCVPMAVAEGAAVTMAVAAVVTLVPVAVRGGWRQPRWRRQP